VGPDGTMESTGTVHGADPMAALTATFVGALADGSWIQRVDGSPFALRGQPEGPRHDTIRFNHVSAEGEVLGEVAAVAGPLRILYKDKTTWGDETPIFGRELISVVSGDRLLVGLNDSLRLEAFSPGGDVLPPLRAPRPPRRATRDLVDAERARRVGEAEARKAAAADRPSRFGDMGAMEDRNIDIAKKIPAEETLPAFKRMLAGSDGRLWVQEQPRPDEGGERWFRMTSGFQPDGWLDVPEGGRLLAAGDGLIVTLVKDDLDVQTVVLYQVR